MVAVLSEVDVEQKDVTPLKFLVQNSSFFIVLAKNDEIFVQNSNFFRVLAKNAVYFVLLQH